MPYRDDPDNESEGDDEIANGLDLDDAPPARGLGGGRSNTYSSIQRDEEDPTHRVRRRRLPVNHAANCTSCLWLCLMILLIISAGLLIAYRYERKAHPELDIVGGNVTFKPFGGFFDGFFIGDNDDEGDNQGIHKGTTKSSDRYPPLPIKDDLLPSTLIPPGAAESSIHYDPKAGIHYYNPFDFEKGDWYGSVAVPPPVDGDSSSEANNNRLGYFSQPNIVGQHLVFISEGDLYYTRWDPEHTTAAMKLTTTVGNIRNPVLNPKYPYYVAFTATYTGHRDVYLMDLRPSHRSQPAMRLTYWDTSYGVSYVVGWKDDGLTLVFAAISNEIGLPDGRLYELSLQQTEDATSKPQVLQISPIPLSQAIDGSWSEGCLYFTRFSQSSNTNRYVGGTAESLWAYCDGEDKAIPLTADYRGRSKSPRVTTMDGAKVLLFMSDRDTTTFANPSTMNLFRTPLPTRDQLYSDNWKPISDLTALSRVSCEFGGLALQEFTVDDEENVVLRIGADLYLLANDTLELVPLNIVVYSDFSQHQERILPVSLVKDVTSFDVFETAFGSTSALLGVRGQLFVAPVVPDSHSLTVPYAGAGMNLPPRRYRVVPGTMTGGAIRVLAANVVPLPQEDGKTTRRLAVILATDPRSATAEHAFYLIEIQSDSAPSFVDPNDLPEPFLGGSKNGGSVANNGLGSVVPSSVTVSPCGRRLAWTDTDGRICVMTMPLYQDGPAVPIVLPDKNDNGEAMLSIDSDLSFSPGGRYLAIEHTAKNQFTIITIADLGDPNIEGAEEVADIKVDRIVQATPSRFNSFSAYWGKTAMDIATESKSAMISKLLGKEPPNNEGATTLFFLSDRDIVSDVSGPWGSRAPSPHFPAKASLYALPLVTVDDNSVNPMQGIYAGGGAAELWADGYIKLQLQVEALEKATMNAYAASLPSNVGGGQRRRLERNANSNHLLAAAAARQARENRRLEDYLSSKTTPAPGESVAPVSSGEFVSSSAPVTALPGNNDGTSPVGPGDGDSSATAETSQPSGPPTQATTGDTTEAAAESDPSATSAPSDAVAEEHVSPSAAPSDAVAEGDVSPSSAPSDAVAEGDVSPSSAPSDAVAQGDVPPTAAPSDAVTEGVMPSTTVPSAAPSESDAPPTDGPSVLVTSAPTKSPSRSPTSAPTGKATDGPTRSPSTAPSGVPSSAPSAAEKSPVFTNDREIDFDGVDFPRRAYRIVGVPVGAYKGIICQLSDDPSLILTEAKDNKIQATLFSFYDFPSDKVEPTPIHADLSFSGGGVSTSRDHVALIFSGMMTVFPNTAVSMTKMLTDKELDVNLVDTIDMSISVWPGLEYEQMFNDAWRMLRDYFYDTGMNGIDWVTIHGRYKNLVKRCAKREELDDVLGQMAAELSALHVFVYGGEYNEPILDEKLKKAHAVASLGATLERSAEIKGYVVKSIAHRDPDFNLINGKALYSPLSQQVLALSGQRGLDVGDVIVGVNGESVMRVPDLHMLLRGMAGRSIRLDVVRQPIVWNQRRLETALNATDDTGDDTNNVFKPEPVIIVPLSQEDGENLRYDAWEWKTRQMAVKLAAEADFTVGYVHLRSMEGPDDVDAFVRNFFPDYDKQALIIDVRHNRGGNIDSWLLDILQRKAWMYWQGRVTNVENGGLGWDQQFAFRGHIVVLIDEKTSSDGEGFARGVSELKLGKLIGTRTWGGGIWLSSDNHLVDGGIATAPEIGTYNDNFGWGLGIENLGVEPDIEVDNNPRLFFDGRDEQLEAAIAELKKWLKDEPIVMPKPPSSKKDMSLKSSIENCPAK